ncbi:MAG TPA: carboxylesterase family protein, partial [Burkholderiales bacterium]|nr:carboxylesterase family protein [Burkholderiales bacterium]
MGRAVLALMLVSVISYAADSPTKPCAVTGADVACTAQGAVRGVIENDLLVFKGLPYAQPPIGNLRWRP